MPETAFRDTQGGHKLFGLVASIALAASTASAPTSAPRASETTLAAASAQMPEAPTVSEVDGRSAIRWKGRTLLREEASPMRFSLVRESMTRVGDTSFFLYDIPSARGKNACTGDDYFVVTVRGDDAWISELLSFCAEFAGLMRKQDGIQLTFTHFDVEGDDVCDTSFGNANCVTTQREAKDASTVTVEGQLCSGLGYTNLRPFVRPDGDGTEVLIDDYGNCSIEDNFDTRVVATIRTTTFANGATLGTCLRLRVMGGALDSPTGSSVTEQTARATTEELARELLRIAGQCQDGFVIRNRVLDQMKTSRPDVQETVWSAFEQSVDVTELSALCVPAVTARLSMDELRALIAFYKTPLGAKLAQALPLLVHEGMTAGATWEDKLTQRLRQRLAISGYR